VLGKRLELWLAQQNHWKHFNFDLSQTERDHMVRYAIFYGGLDEQQGSLSKSRGHELDVYHQTREKTLKVCGREVAVPGKTQGS
jgi:hypothetical protein